LRRRGKSYGYENHLFVHLFCGGCAGALSWFTIMPLDVVKSKLQADIDPKNNQPSVSQKLREVIAKDGVRGLYKGTSAVVIRGFIVNAVILSSYVQSLSFLNKIRPE
jgi:hypothetical protein